MKKAVLVVSFGTSYIETREKTIDKCEEQIKQALGEYDLFRAYTSTMIINKIAKRDHVHIDTPREALYKIYELGYDEVIVQSLHIICGDEFDKLKQHIQEYEGKFSKLTIGRPLLTTIEDYQEAVKATLKEIPSLKEDAAIVFMGHGTTHPVFSAYCALEYAFKEQNTRAYVGTVEGYPTLDNVITQLKEDHIQTVYLMPFMLVAGDHAINDMASDEEDSWKTCLIENGFEVHIILKGLGENPHIQQLFVEHAMSCIEV
ncbi:sirohydrochlorin cobaltochelatase [Cellulosilyticum sp. I15G10I2]|uniref:sirohydrochlorin cobaltochelatase n=1 Tax=Cellulosilyticum sp. I15G10I2 TaxID=1892843 RepID=UPI0009F2E7A3|nr:sirohydrochlorin cobaltochelatase [Cellulosilyticum sp. I15G10I2]